MAVAVFQMKRQRRDGSETSIADSVLYPTDNGGEDNDNVQELKRLYPQHNPHFLMSILETTHGDLSDARCILSQLAATQPRQPRRKRLINDFDNEAMTDRRNSDDKGNSGMEVSDGVGGVVFANQQQALVADLQGPCQTGERSPEDSAIDSLIEAISKSASIEDARSRLQPLVRDWVSKGRVSDTLRRAVIAQTHMLTLCKQREKQSLEARQLLDQELRTSKLQIEELERQLRRIRDRNSVLTLFIKTKFDGGGGGSGGGATSFDGGSGGAFHGGLAFQNQDGFAR